MQKQLKLELFKLGKFKLCNSFKLEVWLGVFLVSAASLFSQTKNPIPDQGNALFAVDSAKREISKKILSPTDKKNIRSCDREKMDFLKACRERDPENQSITKLLNEAKMNSANPEDPAIQSLLEKKFSLEKKCDDKYQATSAGKICFANEAKRQSDLEKALSTDKGYQLLLKKTQPMGSEPL